MRMNRLLRIVLIAIVFTCGTLVWSQDLSLLPKYGSLPKSDEQKAADSNFISAMDEQYQGDRNKASHQVVARGWRYPKQGDIPDAMRRFNQAWLLNNGNGDALWGMAAIQASSGKFDESLKLFAEAEKFVGRDLNFSVDYAKAIGAAGRGNRDDAFLNEAFNRSERIFQKAPQNTNNLRNWAITLAAAGRYSEAWTKVKLAEGTLDKNALDPRFLADLQAHMPRPQD